MASVIPCNKALPTQPLVATMLCDTKGTQHTDCSALTGAAHDKALQFTVVMMQNITAVINKMQLNFQKKKKIQFKS